jgi:hypothetical protein
MSNLLNDYLKGRIDRAPRQAEQNDRHDRMSKDEFKRKLEEALKNARKHARGREL